ncbi:hypothetical protein FA15DRAFT_297245 [Coprinopsis marcescibilis]|uniref:Uncharacterized protein n=1 Tax=Coprinopsis marcescibilis TaxID=230819 RepID=A0A5C3KDS0_COPMA|nr:hypothetical protein FA15DRAFT_297245 [Coprinopsis marcescibilis]
MAHLEWPTACTYVMTTMPLARPWGTSIVELESHAEETVGNDCVVDDAPSTDLLTPGSAKMNGESIDSMIPADMRSFTDNYRSQTARPQESGDGECSGGIDHGWREASLTPAMMYLNFKMSARMCSRCSCSFSTGMTLSVRLAAIRKARFGKQSHARSDQVLDVVVYGQRGCVREVPHP